VTRVTIHVSTAVRLEGRWDVAEAAERVVVFCHPHPLQRGTMNAPLMIAVTRALVERGFAVLRFNYRGVGASTGAWDDGRGEVDDVAAAAALAAATYPDLPQRVAGWSFGAVMSLRWQARDGSTLPWAGIAPPVGSDRTPPMPEPPELTPAPRMIIVGDRDQFTTVAAVEAYAASIGASVEVLQGSDHFFYFREARVGDHVAEALV